MTGRRRTQAAPVQASASERAYAKILDLILTRGLRPTERTSVNLLSERLRLGRTPIKEAITRLQTEGVLTVVGQSGTMVNSINMEQARQIFGLRRALEEFAADAIVANITDDEVGELKRLLGQLHDFGLDRRDIIRSGANFVRANVAFHSLIVSAARNPFLDRLYAQLQVQIQIISYLEHHGFNEAAARKRQEEHEHIVGALVRRDAPGLNRALRIHSKTGEALILQSLAASAADAQRDTGYDPVRASLRGAAVAQGKARRPPVAAARPR